MIACGMLYLDSRGGASDALISLLTENPGNFPILQFYTPFTPMTLCSKTAHVSAAMSLTL